MKIPGQSEKIAWKSIDTAGTGFLQVVQMFAYLLYFKPKLLLIDEPDSHLHPSRQQKLIFALAEASKEFSGTQIIISTHSSALVRSLPRDARISWISDGLVKANGDSVKERMGWSALDKDVIIFTEDGNTKLMESIIGQWPVLQQKCLIWPTFGKDSLPIGPRARDISRRMGVKVLIHRDRDFMTDKDIEDWAKKRQYDTCDVSYWIPDGSDIESLFLSKEHILAALGVPEAVVDEILGEAFRDFDEGQVTTEFSNAYESAVNNLPGEIGRNPIARWKDLGGFCPSTLKGKDYLGAITKACVRVLPRHGLATSISKRELIGSGNSLSPVGIGLHDKIVELLS